MSDTPISDSTPHNVADLGMQVRRLERELNAGIDRIKRLLAGRDTARMQAEQKVESNNDAANAEIERLTAKVAQLYEGADEQKQRIKRLEQENDAMRADLLLWQEQEVKP